jgi:uncharacterized protein (DUF2267 family)
MSMTGLSQFDETVHLTNSWLNQLMESLDWNDRRRAYVALRVVLHEVRDRLPVAEVAHLAAQLPMLVRGFYYEGWRPGRAKRADRSAESFLTAIDEAFVGDPEADADQIAAAVFSLIATRISAGEVEDVRSSLPEGVRKLWPERART